MPKTHYLEINYKNRLFPFEEVMFVRENCSACYVKGHPLRSFTPPPKKKKDFIAGALMMLPNK